MSSEATIKPRARVWKQYDGAWVAQVDHGTWIERVDHDTWATAFDWALWRLS